MGHGYSRMLWGRCRGTSSSSPSPSSSPPTPSTAAALLPPSLPPSLFSSLFSPPFASLSAGPCRASRRVIGLDAWGTCSWTLAYVASSPLIDRRTSPGRSVPSFSAALPGTINCTRARRVATVSSSSGGGCSALSPSGGGVSKSFSNAMPTGPMAANSGGRGGGGSGRVLDMF